MAKVHGRLSTFSWNSNAVGGIVDAAINLERPEIDVTTHDTGDARSFIQGRLAGTIDLTMKWDEADAGQGGMQADFFTATQRAVYFRMNTGGSLHTFTGTAQINSWAAKGPNDDAGEVTASIRYSGAVVEGAQ
ncbi:MAG TPA: phage tail tube protein [Anaerolineae bacterium]|nr:phage tail tube protein [Anaerolineae bacterium]